ncbi:hypothetical protein [Alkalicoccobacillus plakortidis]|uniref:Uncharacterized protein n=1 Tax=Alkalicoccobacillus plakortidis TaxID=444060 RepID=A0ABT0XF43_9BACI|nr:hypothetical protein [Alkalicoccobacillus plakortidis]MCM2674415.1 hypothetical protein [Alkalicoccobacillus plakortidis]
MISTFVQTAVIEIEFLAPIFCLLGQLLNRLAYVKYPFTPSVLVGIGLSVSKRISCRQSTLLGALMGLCYGLAAIGTYTSIKQSWLSFRLFL